MRITWLAVLGTVAMLARPAVAQCAGSEWVIAWMDKQWWGSTHQTFEAGADTVAIAAGLGRATGRRYSPEVTFMVFRSEDLTEARIVAISGGCYAGAWDVEPALIDLWIKRSQAAR